MNKTYRQGDILFRKTESTESLGINVEAGLGQLTIAEGEKTGHHHVLMSSEIGFQKDWNGLPQRIWIPLGGTVVHPEHNAVTLEPGNYEIVRQRQYKGYEEQEPVVD